MRYLQVDLHYSNTKTIWLKSEIIICHSSKSCSRYLSYQMFQIQYLSNSSLEPGIWWLKILKFTVGKKVKGTFYLFKNCNIFSPLWRTKSHRRILQPSKENIQHFKTWNYFHIFALLVRIRIQASKIIADPCGSGSTTLFKIVLLVRRFFSG